MGREMSKEKPLFRPNSSGIGFHPASWQGWLILIGGVVCLAAIIIVIRTVIL